ncbi:hypothetical protein COL154_008176 [Colletotrichum chrysophilum]|nr:hypothetical protein COL154_008176 [Colletotrichum chrysophilum]
MASESLLSSLRSASQVDCDTLDAIAFNELTKLTPDGKLYHEQLIRDAAKDAQSWAKETWSDVDPVLLAVEIMVFNQEPDEDSHQVH